MKKILLLPILLLNLNSFGSSQGIINSGLEKMDQIQIAYDEFNKKEEALGKETNKIKKEILQQSKAATLDKEKISQLMAKLKLIGKQRQKNFEHYKMKIDLIKRDPLQ